MLHTNLGLAFGAVPEIELDVTATEEQRARQHLEGSGELSTMGLVPWTVRGQSG